MNSTCTVALEDKTMPSLASSSWQNSQEANRKPVICPFDRPVSYKNLIARGSATSIPDHWLIEKAHHDVVITVGTAPKKLLIRDLGWTREQAIETRLRLRGFEEDWEAPGMEIYDEL